MKSFILTLSILLGIQTFGQISISGVKKAEMVTDNTKKKDVNRINDINFTKTKQEEFKPKYVVTNEIENSKVSTNNSKVNISIDNSAKVNPNEKNQLILDMNSAKSDIENSGNSNEVISTGNTNQYINRETNTVISTTEDVYYDNNNEIVKESIEINEIVASPNVDVQESNKNSINTTNQQINTNTENITSETPNVTTTKTNTTNNSSSGIYFNKQNESINTTTQSNTPKTTNSNTFTTNNTKENKVVANNSEITNSASKETSNLNPKKGSWSISLRAGVPAIIGDVNSKAGYGTSLSVQKAIGHMFSLRFQALFLETYGLNTKLINNTYDNYKTRFSDYTLQGVITLNNLSFYNKTPKVLYNVIIGGGLATRYTWENNFDANGNAYNYDIISTIDNKTTRKELNELLDDSYETHVPKDVDKMSIKNTNILPTLLVGMGLDIKLSEKFDLNLETRFSNHFDDNLDGLKNGTQSDWMTFTSLGLTYKFGSKNKSLRWTNPVYSNIEELNDLKQKVGEGNLLKDEDKDGIADLFDQDLNTPAQVAVDSRGIPSDIDKDGVPDYKDSQPFTPIGAQVDAQGVALDSDNDGIADIIDLERNTNSGNQVDANGRTIVSPSVNSSPNRANSTSSGNFGLVLFNENSSKVKTEFYSELYRVSKYIQANPSARIQIIGYTDVQANESYNLNLSEKRANAVYSMLIGMFGVSANNLTTSFEGESNPIVKDLPEYKQSNLSASYYLNRRVEFRIID